MPLRVYVAGASKEPERVRWAMDAVRALGCEITLDWLAVIEAEGAANEGLTDAVRRRAARADLDAVGDADVLWLLAPSNASTGAWVELGAALSGRAWAAHPGGVIVSGPARHRCIFAALADEEHDTDEAALASLRVRVGGPR